MKKERIEWQEYFMTQALLIATRSTCPRLSVGCVLTKENQVIATGYNGSNKGLTHCIDDGCLEVNGHCIRTIHAEVNAVTQCARLGSETEGATAYITHYPCLSCTKTLLQAGIKEICYAIEYKNSSYVKELLEQVGVPISKVSIDPTFLLGIVDDLITTEEIVSYTNEPINEKHSHTGNELQEPLD